jgi:predicted AlkP superfamily phosphohydrolase/phosphomutase
MEPRRTLAIFLDGYEESLERRFTKDGLLPNLGRLRQRSARFLLDHGPAQRTGLAGEHVSTGLSPADAHRWSAVDFDPATYALWQEGTRRAPFARLLTARTVVFDTPYFDLDQAPHVQGIVNWGAHDPGVPPGARPGGLLDELVRRIGVYPAQPWLYGIVWASAERTKRMGEDLAQACEVRGRAVAWLLGERLPDWELALVTVSEPHSAIEGLWHGVDPLHPLHALPSAGPAREGLVAVYRAVDGLVGLLGEAFPDANLVVFSTGGMGPNRSDVQSMLLLPELAYRHAFGRPLFRPPDEWAHASAMGPMLGEVEPWHRAVLDHFPGSSRRRGLSRLAHERLPGWIRRGARRASAALAPPRTPAGRAPASRLRLALDWMPAMRYQPYWSRMPFFALPSFYDGRVRVNLEGRERDGVVASAQYRAVCDQIEGLVRACRDPVTGEDAVNFVERTGEPDPHALGPSASDLVVVWKGSHCVLEHPTHGRVGPAPFRRPGGHTGPHGMAYVQAGGVAPGDYGVRSSFDVVPTLCALVGDPVPTGLSGRCLLTGAVLS